MFDNLGLGEFLTLAILALLFFGPERLPQMGAKFGQWVGKLTYQSKLFMNQWREEALAIHEAVEEVRVIRDEIAAAQRQIAETMRAAQNDVSESLEDVKQTVSGSRMSLEELAAAAKEEEHKRQLQEAERKAQGELLAIEKTQAILAEAKARLAATPSAGESSSAVYVAERQVVERQVVEQQTPPSSEPDPLAQLEHAKAEWRKTLAGSTQATETSPVLPTATQTEPPPKAVGETVSVPTLAGPRVVQPPTAEKPQVSTAFDRTAQVMERMRRQLAGEPVEDLETLVTPPSTPAAPVQVETPATETSSLETSSPETSSPETPLQPQAPQTQEAEDEWTRIHNLIQDELKPKKERPPRYATQTAGAPSGETTQAVAPTGSAVDAVSPARVDELKQQVASLQEEIKSLKKAIEALRAEMLLKTALTTPTTRGEHG